MGATGPAGARIAVAIVNERTWALERVFKFTVCVIMVQNVALCRMPSLAVLCAVAAASPGPHAVDPQTGKILFIDMEVLAESDESIALEVHAPQKLGPVISTCDCPSSLPRAPDCTSLMRTCLPVCLSLGHQH